MRSGDRAIDKDRVQINHFGKIPGAVTGHYEARPVTRRDDQTLADEPFKRFANGRYAQTQRVGRVLDVDRLAGPDTAVA
ncbi:MAG: hypothetical protein BGO24_18675 [Sphingomonas sp. 67-36]|nr:MAG: hypothetical protein BGO24_18675 [Sphingomonas sp. 67-36]